MPDEQEIADALQQGLSGEDFAEIIRGESAREVLEETIGPFVHHDFEIAMVSGGAGLRNEYRGAEGFVTAWRDWLTPFERFHIEIEDEVIVSGDVVIGLARQTGVLAGGAELSEDAAAVMFFRDGLLSRVEFHLDRDEAMRAAGLA
jgi:ketosteroid isomerase-like protein